jgi:hypothetical protein
MRTLYLDNSNVIELAGLKNSVTGMADTGAAVAVTLLDSAGVAVVGETWPLTMSHANDGLYRVTLSHDIIISALSRYTAVVDVTGSGGEAATWRCSVTARTRVCC